MSEQARAIVLALFPEYERLPGHCESAVRKVDRILARAAPVEDRLREALRRMLTYIEGGLPEAPDHSCGPESNCDVLCMDYGWFTKEKMEAWALAGPKQEEAE